MQCSIVEPVDMYANNIQQFAGPNPTQSTFLMTQPSILRTNKTQANQSKENRYSASLSNSITCMAITSTSHEGTHCV